MKISSLYFAKGHYSEKGHKTNEKKIFITYFIMRNPYINVQKPSMHGSKVMLCIKNHDERTNEAKSICLANFFKAGGMTKAHSAGLHARTTG